MKMCVLFKLQRHIDRFVSCILRNSEWSCKNVFLIWIPRRVSWILQVKWTTGRSPCVPYPMRLRSRTHGRATRQGTMWQEVVARGCIRSPWCWDYVCCKWCAASQRLSWAPSLSSRREETSIWPWQCRQDAPLCLLRVRAPHHNTLLQSQILSFTFPANTMPHYINIVL